MNRHVPPAHPRRAARVRPPELQRLVRKHEELEALISAARSHGQSTGRLWSAMVCVEDRMRLTFPRAYAHWIAVWAIQRPRGLHPPGGSSPACSLCAGTPPAPRTTHHQAVGQ